MRDSPQRWDKFPGVGVNSLLDGNTDHTIEADFPLKLENQLGVCLFAGKSRNEPGVWEPGDRGMSVSKEGGSVEKDVHPALICPFVAWILGKYQECPFIGTSDEVLVSSASHL